MILGTQDGRRVDSQKLSLDLQTYTMVHMCPIPPLHYKHTHNNDNFLLSQEIPDLGEDSTACAGHYGPYLRGSLLGLLLERASGAEGIA